VALLVGADRDSSTYTVSKAVPWWCRVLTTTAANATRDWLAVRTTYTPSTAWSQSRDRKLEPNALRANVSADSTGPPKLAGFSDQYLDHRP
jgi:hypothetical protein